MRLKVTINTIGRFVPYEYHGFLQGLIYHALGQEQGDFFHDHGYITDNRTYKMFVFSEFQGKYVPSKNGLIFKEPAYFYISCISSDFMNQLYMFFSNELYITLGKQVFEILEVGIVHDIEFHESHDYVLQSLSPITCYKTDEKRFTTYFHPKSQDFEDGLRNNISRKYKILFENDEKEFFEIINIIKCKEVKIKFKKSIYVAYICTMKVHVSDGYLKLLLHTGLGAKNAAGFGMMKIVNR